MQMVTGMQAGIRAPIEAVIRTGPGRSSAPTALLRPGSRYPRYQIITRSDSGRNIGPSVMPKAS